MKTALSDRDSLASSEIVTRKTAAIDPDKHRTRALRSRAGLRPDHSLLESSAVSVDCPQVRGLHMASNLGKDLYFWPSLIVYSGSTVQRGLRRCLRIACNSLHSERDCQIPSLDPEAV